MILQEELLRELFFQDEKERYQRLAAKFNERGGGRNLGFNEKNIECQLVEMGLEALYWDENTQFRPRMRPHERRHSARKSDVQAPQLGVHQVQFYEGMGSLALTEGQKELLYEQVEARGMPDDGDSPMEGVVEDEKDMRIKEEGQQDLRILQQVPRNLTNGHMRQYSVAQDNCGGI